MYEVIYPNTIVSFSRFYFETKNVTINGEEYHSIKCRSKRSAAVFAHWPSIGGIDTSGQIP